MPGMLFRQDDLEGIRAGTITLAFRRWRRPTVRSGGTLLTPIGQITISEVAPVPVEAISDRDARLAGHASKDALVRELARTKEGTVYRIALGALRADPRTALRQSAALTDAELAVIRSRLGGLDRRSASGPWTYQTLKAIAGRPAVRAGDLSHAVGMELPRFKANVRVLKGLGLTESLEIGYRLSPRGARVLRALEAQA